MIDLTNAPEGATHFATISGQLKYVKIDESGKQFIYANGWIPSAFLDERFNLHALKLEINPVFYVMLSMVVITCFVVWFMFWGAK